MLRLEHINDLQTLQRAATLLEKTVVRQAKELVKLRLKVAQLEGQEVDPQMELTLLKEQLAAMQRQAYGTSSERRPRKPKDKDEKAPKKPGRRGHGPRSQPSLPIDVQNHTVPEDDRTCDFCGREMQAMGEQAEESEEITVVGVEYKVVVHRREKLRCACNAQIVTAPCPDKLIPGGRYSIEFAAHVAENKYLDHLPLERQVRTMGRWGLLIDSQTLWDQIDALARHLKPSSEALMQRALASDVVYMDETHWQLLGAKGGTSRWWTWCVASEDTAAYRILNSRSKQAAKQLLDGYRGVIMTDGYGAYESLARDGPDITLAHCWAHVRRKFIAAEDAYPDLSEQAVELIGRLYGIEHEVPRIELGASKEERKATYEMRRRLRHERSRPVVSELLAWALEARTRVLPRSKMGKAIAYMLKLWKGLTLFLDNPAVPLDNNAVERALRGVVVGRKNHYGSKSKRGTEVAALFYTLFESAKLSGVNPRTYIIEATRRAVRKPGTVTMPSDVAP